METHEGAPDDLEAERVIAEHVVAERVVAERRRKRKRHITIFVVVSCINVALLIVLWVALLTPASNATQNNSNDITGLGDVSSPLIGKSAPDFSLATLNGNSSQVSLSNLRGKAVVLNFWQSACDPCIEEAPFMQKTWTQLQSKNVVFVGVDVADTADGAHTFLKKYGITYLNVKDTLTTSASVSYGIAGYPETFFINKQGIVMARWIEPLNAQGMQLELAKLHIQL